MVASGAGSKICTCFLGGKPIICANMQNLPFLPDSDVDGGVVHEVKGFGTDLLLGTGLCPTGGLLLALVPTLLAPGPVSSGVVRALLPPARPPPAVGLVGDESPPPPPPWVFSSTPLS